jgi:hypothetical protein
MYVHLTTFDLLYPLWLTYCILLAKYFWSRA